MAGPVAERGEILEAFQFGGTYTTPGNTVTDENLIAPGKVFVHVGLARVGAAEAIIGVVDFRFTDASGIAQTASFGAPEDWETAIYQDKLSAFTIGLHVARGAAKGWWFLQVWS